MDFDHVDKMISALKAHPIRASMCLGLLLLGTLGGLWAAGYLGEMGRREAQPEEVLVAAKNPGSSTEVRPSEQQPDVSAAAQELASPIQSDEAELRLTPEEIISTHEDERLSKLQKSQFRERTIGAIVRWDVIVRDVTFLNEVQEDAPIFLVFASASAPDTSNPLHVFGALFPRSDEKTLAALRPGDRISIQGRLKYTGFGAYPEPALEDCKLVSILSQ